MQFQKPGRLVLLSFFPHQMELPYLTGKEKKGLMEDKKKFNDPFDGEYIGNIWGWKFSLIGLGLILFLLAIMLYRHWALDVPPGFEELEKTEMPSDSTKVESQ